MLSDTTYIHTFASISLEAASIIVDGALEEGGRLGLRPLTAVVLDLSTYPKALKRADGVGFLSMEACIAKAWTALSMNRSSREIADWMGSNATIVASMANISGGKLIALPGGLLIWRDGAIIGAVGVSGDTPDTDERCAQAGIERAGLSSRP